MGSRVWLVTGASGGLGRALVGEVLGSGARVIATTRDGAPLRPLSAAFPERLRTVRVDITDAGTLRRVLDDAVAGFGRLDVVVNNAGYALAGPFEELDDTELRAQFEVNFFAAVNVLRAALPHLRAAKAGRVLQISSLAGQTGAAGMSAYTASKHALEGLSVSLAAELAPLGIRTTIVEPGAARTAFRANWASRLPAGAAHPDYLPVHDALARTAGGAGEQVGDPVRMARALVALADMPSPPLRLPLGSDALTGIENALGDQLEELRRFATLSASTDHPKAT
ncbi:SDR family oxidoreductase [Goodfellowiella coeruleoviolacea]|uniref:Short-chain dehydrogenase n=1 Tax=Goodfellowiella coeruleoviolacea TaxID=334858 RepID=A0AAE3KEX3_9PSEU|nr:SDR family oxidoreductase [Goodfellowiella coeruleoviolacea]MCP2163849.1 Short-chain dehydrogenase [Goodfellowiella coeruleoviolacea]